MECDKWAAAATLLLEQLTGKIEAPLRVKQAKDPIEVQFLPALFAVQKQETTGVLMNLHV